MRVTLVTYGSEGDTRPFVALGRGLMDAGHDVRLFAEASCLGSAADYGVPAQALAGDLQSILPLENPAAELHRSDFFKTMRASLRLVNGNAEAWARAIAAHAADSDVVLYSSLAAAMGESIARALRKPAIGVWLQPTTPTRAFPAPTLSPRVLPGWLNRLSYRVSPAALTRVLYGNATRKACVAVFGRRAAAPTAPSHPILYGFSRHLVERPSDWPASHDVCGHWPLPPRPFQAPPPLRAFLQAGTPPIYIGFGAMASFFRRQALHEIAAAVAGRRVVFFPGWSRIGADMLPANFFVLGNTPHDWLFPQVSIVVHHGGAGTTHTAARAGVPSVVLPVAVDQFFWAGRLAALGVAPPYVRAADFDAQRLGRLLEFADHEAVRRRAQVLGAALTAEHGVRNAVHAIEAHVFAGGRVARPQARR